MSMNSDKEASGKRKLPASAAHVDDRGQARSHSHSSPQRKRSKLYPIGWGEVEQIDGLLKTRELLEGSSDLLGKMNSDTVFLRMDDLWPDPAKQEVFLRLILVTARSNQEDIRQSTQSFLRKTLQSKLIATVFDKFFLQIIIPQAHVDAIVHSFLGLLFLAWQMYPSKMSEPELMLKTLHVIREIRDKHAQNEHFPAKESLELLDRLDLVVQDKRRRAEIQANEENQQAGSSHRRDRGRECKDSSGPPPDDFRNLPVELDADDILTENQHVYLRKAIARGPYENELHYLDVQFRLLREDLCRPLRNGIRQFKEAANKRKGSKGGELLVYRDVKIIGSELNRQSGQVLVYVQLGQKDQRRRMHRRFKFGSLACLSADGFRYSLIFGTVVDRDNLCRNTAAAGHGKEEENGQTGSIGFQMEMQHFEALAHLSIDLPLCMVESPAFYECYRHVLAALQNIVPRNSPGQTVPFSRYLVRVELNPDIPKYQLNDDTELKMINFECLIESPDQFESTACNSRELSKIFHPEHFGLDQSQFEALAYALQSELAVIQGPPGTGKTHLGLKVVQLLFANEGLWLEPRELVETRRTEEVIKRTHHRPMLVVCYTNHALDQFLEGILGFLKPQAVVRVGGQCKSEKLQQISLSNRRLGRHQQFISPGARHQFYDCRMKMRRMAADLDRFKSHLAEAEKMEWKLPFSVLIHVIEDRFCDRTFFKNSLKMNRWLVSAKKHENCRMDALLVRKIVQNYNLPEKLARIASIYSGNDWHIVWEMLKNGEHKDHIKHILKRWFSDQKTDFKDSVLEWPQLAHINTLTSELGINHAVATELLLSGQTLQQIFDCFTNKTYVLQLQAIAELNIEKADQQKNGSIHLDIGKEEDSERRVHDFDEEMDSDGKSEKDQIMESIMSSEFRGWLRQTVNFWALIGSNRIQPMNDKQADEEQGEGRDPWTLPLFTRWQLYKHWVEKWRQQKNNQIERLTREYCELRKEYEELRAQTDTELMKQAKVIGMTTTAASRLQAALRSVKPRIVVVEEAAEVFEQHILASLTNCCEHLILIGDHQQLRPSPEDYHLGKDYHLDISLFERLVLNGFAYKRLNNQHRMRPEIARTFMPHFYTDLEDHPSVFEYPNIMGMQKNLFFLNHSFAEASKTEDHDFRSHSNLFEAEFAVRLAKYLIQQGYEASQINILCTYSDQFLDMRKRMSELFGKGHGIRVENVDNYQGEECDIIILSLVRSNNQQRKIGFLNVHNRVCVAMSRAKKGFYVMGNIDFLAENCANDLWKNIRQSLSEGGFFGGSVPIVCQMHGTKQEIGKASEFDEKAPEGGCQLPCDFRMDCGHTCRRPCHPTDLKHNNASTIRCVEKCEKMCKNGLHKCELLCFEECGNCSVIVKKVLTCGHIQNGRCHVDLTQMKCQEACEHILNCGHKCANKCGPTHTTACQTKVTKVLPCGHRQALSCSLPPKMAKCSVFVNKQLPICGHMQQIACSVDPITVPCSHPCGRPLPGCEHICKGTCGQCRRGRLHVECAEDCDRILVCGHKCGFKCAKVCPPCQHPCETACPHSQCNRPSVNKQISNKKADAQTKKGRPCGDPCPPCAESCANKCAHRECTKRCGELCKVEPCNEPCRKLLFCSFTRKGIIRKHRCIGVCGEDCPNVCRICNPDKFAELREIFLGYEEEEGVLFVQLMDCKHILEVKGLDKAIQTQLEGLGANALDSSAIVVIKCPKCSTPIRRSKRYIKLLNKRAQQIEQVKRKIIGEKSNGELTKRWKILMGKLESVRIGVPEEHFGLPTLDLLTSKLGKVKALLLTIKEDQLTAQWITTAENIERLLREFTYTSKRVVNTSFRDKDFSESANLPGSPNLNSTMRAFNIRRMKEHLLNDLNQLVNYLPANMNNVRTMADCTLTGLSSELGRNNFLLNLFKLIDSLTTTLKDIDERDSGLITELLSKLFSGIGFSQQKGELDSRLNELSKLHPMSGLDGITQHEMVQIKAALSLSKGEGIGTWYVCSRGHAYNIGSCGQAMERARCPECKETIGGTGHNVVGTSRQIPELNREQDEQIRRNPYHAYW